MELTILETEYFKLLEDEILIKDFENWVYSSDILENELGNYLYVSLLSFKYNKRDSKYELKKLLKNVVDFGKYERLHLSNILTSIINGEKNAANLLIKCYDLLGEGYHFLEYFEFVGYCDNYEELPNVFSSEDKIKSAEILRWFKNEEIILTGNRVGEFNQREYIDNRNIKHASNIWT